jgi:hypothetical protein
VAVGVVVDSLVGTAGAGAQPAVGALGQAEAVGHAVAKKTSVGLADSAARPLRSDLDERHAGPAVGGAGALAEAAVGL